MKSGKNIQYSNQEIIKILEIEGNNRCVDCGSDDPQWASVTNSVFCCLNCAAIHRNLGVEISLVRSLVMDSWDDKQLKQLFLGGNARFISNLEEYGIVKNNNHLSLNPEKIEKKYLYIVSEYYRKLLESELYMNEAPEKPNMQLGKTLINCEENNESQIISEVKEEKLNNSNKGFMGKVVGLFSGLAKDFKTQYKKVEEKVSKMEIKEKLKETGEKTIVLAKKTGVYISDKASKIKNSEFVTKVSEQTEKGFKTVVSKAKKVFNKKEEPGEVEETPEQN